MRLGVSASRERKVVRPDFLQFREGSTGRSRPTPLRVPFAAGGLPHPDYGQFRFKSGGSLAPWCRSRTLDARRSPLKTPEFTTPFFCVH